MIEGIEEGMIEGRDRGDMRERDVGKRWMMTAV
jgi:hypothetical protein